MTYFGKQLVKAIHGTDLEDHLKVKQLNDRQRDWLKDVLMRDLRLVPKPTLTAAVHEASQRISKGENEWRHLRDKAVRALLLRNIS
jgi:hypothetical protein